MVANYKERISDTGKFWFPLDNAAKIFPAILNKEMTTVMRLTVVLKEPVNIKALFKAAGDVEKRFPYFKVQLKEGFFWYYLEHQPLRFPVEVDNKPPCRKFSGHGLLCRIMVAGNRISVEFSHIITDGSGAFEFLKTLLSRYAEELNADIPPEFNYLKPGDPIAEQEFEDSYQRYFREDIPPMVSKSRAFHLPWALRLRPRFSRLNLIVGMPGMKTLARQHGVSVNDFLVSAYMAVLQEIYEEMSNPGRYKHIRVQVPINLRKIFPSETMRNFSLFVMPELDMRLGHYTFDEIIKSVYHQIRLETDKKLINKNISRNVGGEKKIYVKSIPLFLKSMILRMKYYSLGTAQYSGVVTNLGKAKFPAQVEQLVDYFIFTPPPPNKVLKLSCGIIGFNDKVVLSFSSIMKSEKFEAKFLQFLHKRGITAYFDNH